MSICINNDLIWVSIPKCASMSIEKGLMENKELNCTHINEADETINIIEKSFHMHVSLNLLTEHFGELETVCITRNWFDRWLSSLEHIWKLITIFGFTTKVKWKDVDNDYIYNTFTELFLCLLYNNNDDNEVFYKMLSVFVNENVNEDNCNSSIASFILILCSKNYWTNNKKCTYEFDMKDISSFEKFISERYNVDFKIPHINKSESKKSKIIIDEKLKNFVWNNFESLYVKNKSLI